MSATDDLLRHSEEWAASFTQGDLGVEPTLRLAVVACMDSRLDPPALLGLRPGEAHFMRNAGGTVTDDMIRSLVISQRFLGTREIILIHHTDCGMLRFTDDELLRSLHNETGIRPTWAVETFADTEEDLRMSMRRVRTSPFIPYTDSVRGFIYDVKTGRIAEVEA
ncbi:MAG: carbonic anhydrase [Actinobacteria bacterium]|nr:carbonic anhydrase [Actinomycetota bacterium]MBM3697327.1 carbonic anhydrase [Actinomycetota bacterium]